MTTAAPVIAGERLEAPTARRQPGRWIFSLPVDLGVFVLPALLALALWAVLPLVRARAESPEWVWVVGVLLVDVAHVWSTAFVTYLNPGELRRHPERYWLVPGGAWVAGVLLYGIGGGALFWRALAYLAVFHFVRQQYGWMALYRARAGDRARLGAWIDGAAIYAATLYPLLWWHAHLPREFSWFAAGDFISGVPLGLADAGAVAYALSLCAYALRALHGAWRGELVPWGKHLLLASTALTWYAGIVATNDDIAFTLTNVLAHGIPYAVLVFSFARFERRRESGLAARWIDGNVASAALRFVACLWLLAYFEELLWDRGVWHEHPALFGAGPSLAGLEPWLVPLLAVPQVSHYVLDGTFWRRANNPRLRQWLAQR